ncbi:hypothetical protein JQ507_14965 [Bradyrhizobium sp. PSBB068]|nr:hypothetical protein JQ507_14965 [Bradyrhizobium sp. PSBB068]
MSYLSSDQMIKTSEAFSVPLALFRVAYTVSAIDFENATHDRFESEKDLASVLDKILAARKMNHHLYRSTPFAPPTPAAFPRWRFDFGSGDDVITELKKDTFFGEFEGENHLEKGIGRREIWRRIVDEANQAFAVSVRIVSSRATRLSGDDLADVIDGICLDHKFDQPAFWPDFDEIAKRIQSLG